MRMDYQRPRRSHHRRHTTVHHVRQIQHINKYNIGPMLAVIGGCVFLVYIFPALICLLFQAVYMLVLAALVWWGGKWLFNIKRYKRHGRR